VDAVERTGSDDDGGSSGSGSGSQDQRIAVVGVGRMGANIARRLKDVGYTITAVHDVRPETAREVAGEVGAQAAGTLAAVTKAAGCVITVVSDDAAMQRIFADPAQADDGLLAGATGRLFVNCATVSPAVHVEVERRAAAAGAQTLEACMASSIPQAREGTLYLMCGGTPEAFERAKPILQAMSSALRYVGGAGQAAKVKALVNMVMNSNTAALAEGLGLGAALGLDLTLLREVFSQTGANSRVLETDGEDMQAREHSVYFSAAHAAKDSGIALALASQASLSLPVAEAARRQFERLVELGKGELDKSAVAELTFPGRS
jgi:3-hydroxyisobutyrate dehydrogenase